MRSVRATAFLVIALSASPLFARARVATNATPTEIVAWTAGVNYSYDGSGNIRQIGNDRFLHDTVGRLTQAEVNGVVRTYQYDAFGNRTNCVHGPDTPMQSDCQNGITVDPNTNRVNGVEYDEAGNVETHSGHRYSYDAVNMPTRDDRGNGLAKEFIYTASDERIAVYTVGSTWNWTIRDTSDRVLREFTSSDAPGGLGTGSWRLAKNYVWRDGLLLASTHVAGEIPVTHHYHLDHLGTPRRVTDQNNKLVGFHDYYAFGSEVSGGLTEPASTSLQYTGHERDKWGGAEGLDTLDYMHARYYSPVMGRFLAVDPLMEPRRNMATPQRWNRYAYALNNPITGFDPDGRKDTIYIVNTLGRGAFNSQQLAALRAAVKGTRFEGRIKVIGPMASHIKMLNIARRADSTDMVGILIHSGRSSSLDPSGTGNLMTQKALDKSDKTGVVQGVTTGAQLGGAVNDSSPAGVCMIAGCSSDQVANTVAAMVNVTTFGTDNFAGADQQGNSLVATFGALANGASPEEAAAAGTAQYTRRYKCGGATDQCDPSRPARLKPAGACIEGQPACR